MHDLGLNTRYQLASAQDINWPLPQISIGLCPRYQLASAQDINWPLPKISNWPQPKISIGLCPKHQNLAIDKYILEMNYQTNEPARRGRSRCRAHDPITCPGSKPLLSQRAVRTQVEPAALVTRELPSVLISLKFIGRLLAFQSLKNLDNVAI